MAASTGLIMAMVAILAITTTLMVIIMVAVYASRYKKVPPDQAMVVYGKGGKKGRAYDIVTGGGRFIMPIFEAYAFMPLDARTINKKFRNVVLNRKGKRSKVDLDSTVVVKISSQDILMRVAAEMLLHKTDAEIDQIAMEFIEKNVHSVCGKITKEKLESDPDSVSEAIESAAAKEMRDVGLEIKTFKIKEVLG